MAASGVLRFRNEAQADGDQLSSDSDSHTDGKGYQKFSNLGRKIFLPAFVGLMIT